LVALPLIIRKAHQWEGWRQSKRETNVMMTYRVRAIRKRRKEARLEKKEKSKSRHGTRRGGANKMPRSLDAEKRSRKSGGGKTKEGGDNYN